MEQVTVIEDIDLAVVKGAESAKPKTGRGFYEYS